MVAEVSTVNSLLAWARESPETGLRLLDRRERESFRSWREVATRAEGVCGALQATGVGRGERVALVYPTSFDFVVSLFGVLLAGAVPVPLYPPLRLGRLEEHLARTVGMVEAAGASLVLADGRVAPLLGRLGRSARLGCQTLAGLPDGTPSLEATSPDELALVQFSSGTTSDPKPVALSHRALSEQVRRLNAFWPDADGVVHSGVSWLPLYHDMGLIGCILPALERPGTLTLIPPELFVARPALWLRAISRFRATLSPAPNFAFGLCVERVRDDELRGVDLSSWRVALCGAEPVTARAMRAFQARFAPWGLRPEALTPVYGLSEASLAVTFSDVASPFVTRRFDRERLSRDGEARTVEDGVEIVSVGKPLPGFSLQIVDGSGRRLPAGRVGRVRVAGPSLMEEYLGRPQATRRVLRDGWLDTGDLGFVDGGELFLTGRAKDVIILRGHNHSPQEIEAAVDGVPGVRRGCGVAVAHLPEGAPGERLLLLVEARKGTPRGAFPALAEACAGAVRAEMGISPDEVVVLPAGTLPRTSSRKLRRAEALRRHLAGTLTPPRGWNALRLARTALDSMAIKLRRRLEANARLGD
jgi:acyl-CoA synthetase (AMP-forming)/AMP-acid ligase II